MYRSGRMNTPACFRFSKMTGETDQSAWAGLLPDEDFRFHFGLQPGDAAEFFASTQNHANLIQQRRHWLEQQPQTYSALLPESATLLFETLCLARQWQSSPNTHSPEVGGPLQQCLDLGRTWEPDFLLLKPDADGQFRLVAACVCFPSSWRLADKIGLPLEAIHAPVPTLNPSLGKSIGQFLAKLRPGPAWLRANWGLSRSPELNQHPARNLPRLIPPLAVDEVWLRIEHQALVALPETGGILFGIRLEIVPLAEVKQHPTATRGLIRALRTMPEKIATYKNLIAARDNLIELLQ